jgi:hypothetical protein
MCTAYKMAEEKVNQKGVRYTQTNVDSRNQYTKQHITGFTLIILNTRVKQKISSQDV